MATQRMRSGQHEPVDDIASRPEVPMASPRRIASADPHTHSVRFGHEPEQIKSARGWCWQTSGLTYDQAYPLLLALSELHTNAIAHTASGLPGGRVRVDLTHRSGSLRLAVTDQGPLPGRTGICPHPCGIPPGEDLAEHGRGLALVQAVSRDWGYFRSCGAATTVWAIFDRNPPSRG